MSLTHSWTPKISELTNTTGCLPFAGGPGEVAGDLAVGGLDFDGLGDQACVSVVIGSASARKAATA